MLDTTHLAGRCGLCKWWKSYQMGVGYCELVNERFAPIGLSDGGGVQTRIDFGCLAHEGLEPIE